MSEDVKATEQLARFVVETDYHDLPEKAVAAAKRALVDYAGVALAGSLEPASILVANSVKRMGCNPVVAVMGSGFRTSASNAAMANGTMAHVLDYDDISTTPGRYPLAVHMTGVLYSTILALGEELAVSGQDIVTAYVLGYEVASQVASAMGPDYGDDLGWHPTPIIGTIGASAAAAKILKLDVMQTIVALGIAASHASGIRQNFGTMTKSLHIGHASSSAVMSAMLAGDGFTSSTDPLEGRYGFCHAFSGGRGYDTSQIAKDLGMPFKLVSHGPAVKLYPCCGSAHGALNALFMLLDKHDVQAENVSAVEVKVPFDPPRSLVCDNPNTALEGKFSLQYCLAATLVDRKVGLGTFTTEQVQRPEVRRMFEGITMFREPGMEGKPSWEPPEYVVTLKMKNGESYSEQARAPFVAPMKTATTQELADKYRDCAGLVLSENNVAKSLELINNLETLEDITRLADIFVNAKQ